MTVVRFHTRGGLLAGFEARGHADFADPGYDIVCAAVSALTQTAASALDKVLGASPEVVSDEPRAVYRVVLPETSRKATRRAHDLLSMLYVGLADLQEQYPRYVRLIGRPPRILE